MDDSVLFWSFLWPVVGFAWFFDHERRKRLYALLGLCIVAGLVMATAYPPDRWWVTIVYVLGMALCYGLLHRDAQTVDGKKRPSRWVEIGLILVTSLTGIWMSLLLVGVYLYFASQIVVTTR